MNIVSNHNRLLRGAAIPTAGGDMWTSGLEYTQNGEISGYSGSAFYQQECPCDSAAIVDSAFNKSTAWVDEQNYLTAHQDISNLPYVQNSALEFSPQGLISGISGSGLYATSAENAFTADTAYFAYNAEHADSADYAETTYSAQFANSASSALNAEVANISYTALTAQFLDGGWEHDDDGFITAYNNSAFAGNGGGGRYEGISPIVVNNEEMRISAKSALLGVQEPLYFVEDSETATVIGVHESAFTGRDWTDDITAASANAYNEAVNNITAVRSADSATYDSLGRKIVDTYLTAHQQLPDWTPTIQNASGNAYNSAVNWVVDQHYLTGEVEYSAGQNIDITNHVVSGKDWTSEISDASANAVNEAVNTITAVEFANSASALTTSAGWDVTEYIAGANIDITNHVVSGKDWTSEIANASAEITAQIPDVTGLPYVENSALDYTPGGHLVSSISGDALYAVSAECSFTAETANYSYVAETANYVADGWEYNENNEITGYSGSAIHSEAGGEGKVYTGVAPIVVDNSQTTGVISAQTARLGVQSPLYFVEDTSSSTVIGISGDLTGQYIPYTATDTNKFITNSALIVSAGSGYVEINSKNDTYTGEAHIHVHQQPTNLGIDEWWAEIDGDGYGHIQQHWSASTGLDSAMFYEYNGFTFATGAVLPYTMVAEWLTGDWINAKALYNHVNTASANWTNNIPYIATDTKTFVTNSAIQVTASALPVPGAQRYYYSTAQLGPSSLYTIDVTAQQGFSASGSTNILGSTVFLSAGDTYGDTYERRIYTNSDTIYSGGNFIVDVVKAAVTVKDNSASWANVRIVASTADATGTNIIYFVTGA